MNTHTAVISHDAGGAELLSAYLKRYPVNNPVFYIKGPAKRIFKKKGLIDPDYKFNPAWNPGIDHLLSSMSWKDNFAFGLIKKARQKGIKTELILDSWYEYSRRFGFPDKGWQKNLPDVLVVCDSIAEKIIKTGRLNNLCRVKKIDNPYFEEMKREYLKLKTQGRAEGGKYLLFLSCPIKIARENGLRELSGITVTERELLRDIALICKDKKIPIKIRLHPAQKGKEMLSCGSFLRGVAVCKSSGSLLEDLRGARYVVGFCSTALIIAALLGKTAISFSKGDLKDIFNWGEYEVYRYYGIHNCTSINSVKRFLS